jgi:hypothetical protein
MGRITSTYTCAELGVSAAAYEEIRGKLEAAGYQHAIGASGLIDMHGIGLVAGSPPDDDWPEAALAWEILREMARARSKFPGENVTTLALVEEVGELARATFGESRARVREEAVQVAAMAMRVVLDGDDTLASWRAARGLDGLAPYLRPAASEAE